MTSLLSLDCLTSCEPESWSHLEGECCLGKSFLGDWFAVLISVLVLACIQRRLFHKSYPVTAKTALTLTLASLHVNLNPDAHL